MRQFIKNISVVLIIIGLIGLWAGLSRLSQPASQEEAEEQYYEGPGLVRR